MDIPQESSFKSARCKTRRCCFQNGTKETTARRFLRELSKRKEPCEPEIFPEAEGLRKFQSYLDIDIDLKDPLEGEEMRYCINVDLGMKLDDIDSISEEVKNTINTNAAAMLRKRFIQLKTDLVRRMEKAENDSLQ